MLGPLALAGLPVGEETQSEGSKQGLQRFAMKTNHLQPPLALCVHEAILHTDTQYTAEAGMTRRGGRPMLTSHPVCTSSHQYLLLSPLPYILPYSPTSLLHHYSHYSPPSFCIPPPPSCTTTLTTPPFTLYCLTSLLQFLIFITLNTTLCSLSFLSPVLGGSLGHFGFLQEAQIQVERVFSISLKLDWTITSL